MSLKIIDRNIRTITGNISKLNDLIQSTGMLILAHASEHGDCTRALVLVKAMPASFRRNLLVSWFERNSPIRINLTNDKVGMLKDSAKGFTPFDLEAAAAVPFYVEQTKESAGPKQVVAESFDKAFDSFIKPQAKALADGNVPDDQREAIEARLNVLGTLIRTIDSTKGYVEFVLPAAPAAERNPLLAAA